jgi:hypothetical protein
MPTGGEQRDVRHERRLSAASISCVPGPSGPADVLKRNAGVGLAATAFDLQPAVAAN